VKLEGLEIDTNHGRKGLRLRVEKLEIDMN
jgi:hypothetical protein